LRETGSSLAELYATSLDKSQQGNPPPRPGGTLPAPSGD
jgi:hypothetical protein